MNHSNKFDATLSEYFNGLIMDVTPFLDQNSIRFFIK